MLLAMASFVLAALFPVGTYCCFAGGAHPLHLDTTLHTSRSASLSLQERVFLDSPSNVTARSSLEFYTREPHAAGTLNDYALANWTASKFREYGLEAEVQAVDTLLSYPISRSVDLFEAGTGALLYSAVLDETVLPEDSTSNTPFRKLTYLGYAPSGAASGRLVYANFGRPEDFDVLEAAGVSVNGSVVITRYGKCFRGLKAMNAQRRGAAALIIYSDPEQDGFAMGDEYPKRPLASSQSVQRGSIQFNTLCAGDPGRAYLNGSQSAQELCGYPTEELVPRIPVLPMGWGDAEHLLRALEGPDAPAEFCGALDLTYRLGSSTTANASSVVKVVVRNDFETTPIWNVVARVPGVDAGTEKDRPVLLGNHRDAWVFGAADPNSGSATLLEVGKGLGELLKGGGWRPKRSIYLLSWSGEEFGLLGSTAWAETNAADLLRNATAYLNVDIGISGPALRVSATPALGGAVMDVLAAVIDPSRGGGGNDNTTLLDRWDGKIGTLGSGSDYTVFLDHLGIASVDLSFHPDDSGTYGTYHSIYDSFDWMLLVDPDFKLHEAMARLWGVLAIRFASDDVLPFNHSLQSDAIDGYLDTVKGMLSDDDNEHHHHHHSHDEEAERTTNGHHHHHHHHHHRQVLLDVPSSHHIASAAKNDVVLSSYSSSSRRARNEKLVLRGVDLTALEKAASEYADAAKVVEQEVAEAIAVVSTTTTTTTTVEQDAARGGGGKSSGNKFAGFGGDLAELNDRLAFSERQFLAPEGLPKRKWFKHVLQSPGLYLGYDADVFPGIVQAIRDEEWDVCQEEVDKAARSVANAAAFLRGGDDPSEFGR